MDRKKFTIKDNFIFLVGVVVLFNLTYSCGEKNRSKKIIKQNELMTTKIDSLSNVISAISDSTITLGELENRLELNGYRVSLRNLYHNNAIVRSKERPDDVMHKYNQKIEELTKKVK